MSEQSDTHAALNRDVDGGAELTDSMVKNPSLPVNQMWRCGR